MKKRLLAAVFYSLYFLASAQVQNWGWAKSGNGAADETANHLTLDGSGNLILTGSFSSASATLSSVVLNNSGSSGTKEFLIAKYDQAGVLQWAKRAQGAGDDEGVAVTTDPTGNIYATGNYDSPTIVFGTTTLTNSSAIGDLFVVKYDPAGNVLWAKSYGGNLLEQVRSIKADNSGNTYIAGLFRSLSVSFDAFGVINSGNSDAFLAKIDVNGSGVWAKQVGGSQNESGLSVTHDGAGNVFLMGEYNSTTLPSYTLTNAGGFDIFISRYDAASGNLLNTRNIGGPLNETGYSMVTDPAGNLYLAGSYESGSLNLGSVTLTNGSSRDMMLVKLNQTLVTQWALRNLGNLTSNATALFIDQSPSLYVAGTYNVPGITFGSSSIINASGGSDGFLVKYDLAGNDLSAKGTSHAGSEQVNGIVVDNAGSVYVAGSYDPTLVLASNNLTGSGGKELFLAKLCVLPAAPVAASNITVCAKATGTLSATPPAGSVINWYATSTGGSPLLSASNTFTANTSSTYYAEALNTSNGCTSTARVPVTLSVQPGALVSVSGKTLTASAGSAYKWIECQKDSLMQPQTSQTYAVARTGYYAAIVTNNGCVDTTACVFYSVNATTGTITVPGDTIKTTLVKNETNEQPGLIVYPNPNSGSFTIQTALTGDLHLSDLLGREIKTISITGENNGAVHVEGLPCGIYFLSGERTSTQRIVVTSQ